jgi:4-amino-4-deoxy-L-arabinose transferase-like glycosyltransferase
MSAAISPRRAVVAVGPRMRAGARACGAAWEGIPRAGRACFLIAFVNVAIWTVIIPPWQVPDETTNFAYAQYLAETGSAPPQYPSNLTLLNQYAASGLNPQFSPQQNAAVNLTWFAPVAGNSLNRGIFTTPDERNLRAALASQRSALGPGSLSSATNQPPLYYALEAIPYWISPSNNVLTRLEFMRLFSALLAACTVLVIFLFLRELLPGTRWTWTTGALMVAFQPQFDFVSAGVNGDNLLYLASALTFLALVRAWRRGLTTRRAVAIGAVLAVGMLAKLTFLALVPGAGLATLLLVWRDRGASMRAALGRLAIAVSVAAVPVGVYLLLNVTVWGRGSPLASGLSSVTASTGPVSGGQLSWHAAVDYAWELFLPRLPFMNHVYFPTYFPLWQTWLDGSIGHFGWLDYTFPGWVYADFRWVVYVLGGLGVIGLWRVRRGIRPLLGLFAGYAVMGIGLLAVIGYLSAQARFNGSPYFPQARYLFPLVALYALAIVLATRALPRRWAPVLGALLVALAFAHNLFAETLTISRYYG